ncbi:MAG: NAD(P)-dependent oxidoreductase [Verrucomicrobia bacterium]|nr:NAD(P)-dependent oxidoreductase [Verrucomicrobiota bacterium]MDA1069262.1 NAD(P)-dependent oxidoreductase [Verrucomicrobiota bacterium]
MTLPKIGFVGVGRMGFNMAERLHDCNYPIAAVYDLNLEIAESLAEKTGAKACQQLKEVSRLADIIFTVVSDDAAMRHIFYNEEDNLLMEAIGKTFINCATLSPSIHVELQKACHDADAQSLEACMASSIPQARAGTLYLMVGGTEIVFTAVKDLLEKLSTSLRYVGPAGSASQVKALVNMVMNINTAALAEGLGLGQALGLDLKMLCEIFAQTGANSRVLETDAADMLTRDHDCYFSAEHAAKDSGIALALANEAGILSLPRKMGDMLC